jgi:hypothetical protein
MTLTSFLNLAPFYGIGAPVDIIKFRARYYFRGSERYGRTCFATFRPAPEKWCSKAFMSTRLPLKPTPSP